jgi:hypothetical protein
VASAPSNSAASEFKTANCHLTFARRSEERCNQLIAAI